MCSLTAIGIGLSVGGALMQGVQAQQMANYQAKAYEQQAQADAQASAFEAARERDKQRLMEASARAQVGASGVALQGSPTEVLAANSRQAQLDIKAIQYGSQLRQNNLKTQADISRFQGKQAMGASIFSAGSNFVSGLSQLYDPNRATRFGGSVFA